MPATNGQLYIVATPIGNLGDITMRAGEMLRGADVVYCEDTRVTAKLLASFDIRVTTRALHEHTDDRVLQDVIAEVQSGKIVCYVSDAGTPGIADPGGKLVAMAVAAGIRVTPIPGPSAVATALSIAGVPADRYFFAGFPPHKKGRQTFFAELAARPETLVLYESTHRIEKTLQALPQDRHTVVCRELTKLHETVYRGLIPEICTQLAVTSTKGEFVIVIAPQGWRT